MRVPVQPAMHLIGGTCGVGGEGPRSGPLHVASVAPLLSKVYARWFSLELKTRGNARQFGAEIVNRADDLVICGRVSEAAMRVVVERMRSPLNATKCRCVHGREEPLAFLRHIESDATTSRCLHRRQ